MDRTALRMIRDSHQLSDRELARQLSSKPKTLYRWMSGYTPIPAVAERLIDFQFGDGTPGSALETAKTRICDAWQRFVLGCRAKELALVAIGADAVEFDPDCTDLFSLVSFSEDNDMLVYMGDVSGCECESLEAVRRLLEAVGREEDASQIHDLVSGLDGDSLGPIIAPLIGAMEREEMLRFDVFQAVDEAMTLASESEEDQVGEEEAEMEA